MDKTLKKLNSSQTNSDFIEETCIKYKDLVRKIARNYFLQAGDEEDLIQEGMIGLYKAIFAYSKEKGSFSTFASLCIRSQILNAIRQDCAKKHALLNSGISFEQNNMAETYASGENVLENLENLSEQTQRLKNIKKVLSPKEGRVLDLYLEGLSYAEMAQKENTNTKSIENTIKRIKEKLREKTWNNI